MSGDEAHTLDIEVHTRANTKVVAVRGEIDIVSVPQLQAALEQAGQDGAAAVADLSGVGFMGSAGLSALLVVADAAKPERLRVVASTAVRRPIEVTGLDKVLAVFDTLDAALAAGRQSVS